MRGDSKAMTLCLFVVCFPLQAPISLNVKEFKLFFLKIDKWNHSHSVWGKIFAKLSPISQASSEVVLKFTSEFFFVLK